MSRFPRKGDVVQHYLNIRRKGTVIDVISRASNQWLIGGTTANELRVAVQWDDNTTSDHSGQELSILEPSTRR